MKVITAQEMARIEEMAYLAGSSEEEFMENAGVAIADHIRKFIANSHVQPKIVLLCGRGNNGGDAFAAGRHLIEADFKVSALALSPKQECSRLSQIQCDRYQKKGGKVEWPKKIQDINFQEATILIDGIFGTGFKGKVEGFYREVIELANASNCPILSIDIPSGINGTTGEVGDVAIMAKETLFLGLPKTGCFISNAWNFVGKVHVCPFGLSEEYISRANPDYFLIEEREIKLPPIKRNRHKYEAGYVAGIGGSKGMPGAGVLSSFAALRSGAGLMTFFHPKDMQIEFSGAPLEIIREEFTDPESVLKSVKKAASFFIGPGMKVDSLDFLRKFLTIVNKPIVIDAGALSLIAENDLPLPPSSVLTPHYGEMKQLLKLQEDIPFHDFLQKCQRYSEEKKTTVVMKGSPTFIFHPNEVPYVCDRGDPGMATAGSGDVLTGIIASFLAAKKEPFDAAKHGVFFHSLAGEIAADEVTSFCMVATDIIKYLPAVFKKFTFKY